MKKVLIFLLLLVVGIVGYSVLERKSTTTYNLVKQIANKTPHVISIYRFGDFPESSAKKLEVALKTYFPKVEYKTEILPLPKEHYNKERNRYLGTGLFDALGKARGNNAAIGLTNYIIYKPNEISKTFGIMGVSPVGKYICVVSNKIPRGGRTQTDDNLVKLSLHELGHSFGLPHCPDQHCFMVDAEHKMKLPQSYYFCPKCRKYLNDKGWSIK